MAQEGKHWNGHLTGGKRAKRPNGRTKRKGETREYEKDGIGSSRPEAATVAVLLVSTVSKQGGNQKGKRWGHHHMKRGETGHKRLT